MARKNDSPQKAAMREMMRDYLKNNDISIKNGTDVNAVMRDMMSVLLEGALDEEVSIGAERSFRISPPSFFCISRASIASIGPMFCLVLSNVPGSSVLAGLSSAIISSVLSLSGCYLKPDLESFCNSRE